MIRLQTVQIVSRIYLIVLQIAWIILSLVPLSPKGNTKSIGDTCVEAQ